MNNISVRWIALLLTLYYWQAPYRWIHAGLAPIKQVLREQVAEGEYTPLFSKGLHDDL